MNTGEASQEPEIALDEAASRRALDAIRRDALDGLLALPRVGMGIGGLLAGTKRENRLQILERIEIPCLHARGPGFLLTADELENARELAAKAEPLHVLGMYISKTRGALEPGDADLETFASLCPRQGQVLLIIRPSTVEPVRATLFLRDTDGRINPRFDVCMNGVPHPTTAPEPTPPPAPPNLALQAVKRTLASTEQTNVAETNAPGEMTTGRVTIPSQPVVAPPITDVAARVEKSADQSRIEPLPEKLPRVAKQPEPKPIALPLCQTVLFQQRHQRESPRRAVLYTCGALALIAAAAVAALDMLAPKPELTLNASEENGALVFRWNRNAVPGADRGRLLVNDAGELREFPLDAVRIGAGSFPYRRKSDRILAKLVIGDRSARAEFFGKALPRGASSSNSRPDSGRAGDPSTN